MLPLTLLLMATAADVAAPNVIVIYTDDQGYGDVHRLNPDAKFPTPHMDRLASEGITFARGHSSDSVCTPSRYGLLTGRYAWRTELKKGVYRAERDCLIADGRMTLASLFKESGYQTAMVGKWHLGMDFPGTPANRDWNQPVRDMPLDKGFDYFYGIPASLNYGILAWFEGRHAAVPPILYSNKKRNPRHMDYRIMPPYETQPGKSDDPTRTVATNFEIAEDFVDNQCLTQFTDKAIGWMKDNATETATASPFFLYLAYTSPHYPVCPLPAPTRKLGLRLLRERREGLPADLREDPKNIAFLNRMEKLQIRPAAWLSDRPFANRCAQEHGVEVRFDSDPFEVFQMGAHFQTCLTPSEMNFYATIANAADINKRVLFARTRMGKVVARCLFALTDRGKILTFHPYSHDGRLEFPSIVDQCAKSLATRMRTERASGGTVETLVSSAWYDDGAVAQQGNSAFLDQESRFRRSLALVSRDEFPKQVARHIHLDRPDAHLLCCLLDLPEFKARPELAITLVDVVSRTRDLPCHSRLIELLAKTGQEAEARALVQRLNPRPALLNRQDYLELQKFLLAIPALAPQFALKALRWTRPSGIRKWADEFAADLFFSAAVAHETMHRPRMALKLYEQLLENGGFGDLPERTRARVSVLQAILPD